MRIIDVSNSMMNIGLFWMKEVRYKKHKLHESTYIQLWKRQLYLWLQKADQCLLADGETAAKADRRRDILDSR